MAAPSSTTDDESGDSASSAAGADHSTRITCYRGFYPDQGQGLFGSEVPQGRNRYVWRSARNEDDIFNHNEGLRLLERAGYPNIAELASKLDTKRAEVIAALFLNHTDW